MNRIVFCGLMLVCLVGTTFAQGASGGSASTNYLASRMLASGGAGGMGGMSRLLPLLALSGGGNDALMPLMFCRGGMNFMCMMALSQGGIM